MTRRREKAQQDELTAFVRALKEAAGYVHTSDWATESGYSYPNLSKLMAGKGGVDGYNLLRLIRVAAARAKTTPGELAVETARATDSVSDIDREILRRLNDISAGVAKALDLLAPDDQASGEEPQTPGRKSG